MRLPSLVELHAKTQKVHLDFLETELSLCFTFGEVAATEMSTDKAAAQHALAKAEEGYDTVNRFLMQVDPGSQRQEIQQRLNELRAKLDGLQSWLSGAHSEREDQ